MRLEGGDTFDSCLQAVSSVSGVGAWSSALSMSRSASPTSFFLLVGELYAVLETWALLVLRESRPVETSLPSASGEGFQLCHVGAAQTCGLLCGSSWVIRSVS